MRQDRFALQLFALLLAIVLTRLALLAQYPLIGTTEPRYAELARQMLSTGDWVTLWVADGVPLWGKPPLLFWLEALFMKWLGINEFALRLPTFIASIFTMSLLWFWPRINNASDDKPHPNWLLKRLPLVSVIASLIYISTPFGFFAAGFVATDIFLTLGITLSMLSFWLAIQSRKIQIWHWNFFIGIAIGLLAKGPLTLVLLGLSLFLWSLFSPKERLSLVWKKLPWWRGLTLSTLIAGPWYLMAELRTPGFLNHFIIGEHIERFLFKDWAGGRFAASHGEPLGLIWWFAVEAFMPWLLLSFPALYFARKNRQHTADPTAAPKLLARSSEWQYLLSWIFAPLLLFSASRNILEAYTLTALPAFALLMSLMILGLLERRPLWRWSMLLCTLIPLTVVVAVVFFNPVLDQQSQKHLLKNWTAGTPLIYLGKVPPSAIFYSRNQATDTPSLAQLETRLKTQPTRQSVTLVMDKSMFEQMPAQEQSAWQQIETYGQYIMLRK